MKIDSLKYRGLIAPCGMNCGICIGYLRDKKPCASCFRKDDVNKPKNCRSCSIANCDHLLQTDSGFCYDCKIYPCYRLRRLDKRYRTKYKMSMLENLNFIKDYGMLNFLKNEEQRWICRHCGAQLSVHRSACLKCNSERLD